MRDDVVSARDQTPMSRPRQQHDQHRAQFAQDLIAAISDAKVQRCNRPESALAAACWEKLQYDLPVVDARELEALLSAFKCVVHWLVKLRHF